MEEFIACFSEVSDPRQDNVRHNLYEVLMIALCTMLCGGEDCCDMEAFGRAKRPFLRQFLRLRGSAGPADGRDTSCGGSVRFGAIRFYEFRPWTPALKLPPGRREQSRFSAYAASAAPQPDHVDACEIGTGESFAVRHSRGSSVLLISCSSVQASVDIGS